MSGPAEVYNPNDELDFVKGLGTWAVPAWLRTPEDHTQRTIRLLKNYITHCASRMRMPAPFFDMVPGVRLAIHRLRMEFNVTAPEIDLERIALQ